MPTLAWNVPLVSLIFLKRSLAFPTLLFSSSLPCSLQKAFLSLLGILWSSALCWVYLSLSPLPFTSILFSAICKASSDNHFAFLHSFSWGWFWSSLPVQCYKLLSIVLQILCLSDLIPWIYWSPILYNHKIFDLDHTWMAHWFFPTFFNLSLNFAERSWWSEPQSAQGLVFAYCIELLHLQLQRI